MLNITKNQKLIYLTEEELAEIKKEAFEKGYAKAKEKKTVSKPKVKTNKGELRNNIVE